MEENKKEKLEWYYNGWIIFLAILLFGPLGLLLLWFRPKANLAIKIGVSLAVIVLTIWMTYTAVDSYQKIVASYKEMEETSE